MAQQSQDRIIEENIGTWNRRQHRREEENDSAQNKIDTKPENMFSALALQEPLEIAGNLAPGSIAYEMNYKTVRARHGL